MNNFRRKNDEIASSACLKSAASPGKILHAGMPRAIWRYMLWWSGWARFRPNRPQTTEKYTANVVSQCKNDNKRRRKNTANVISRGQPDNKRQEKYTANVSLRRSSDTRAARRPAECPTYFSTNKNRCNINT